jgi:DNA repair ATPase RecN
MISDEVGIQLHDRASRGGTLSPEERAALEAWYAQHDAEDAAGSKWHAVPVDVEDLRLKVQATLVRIEAAAQRMRQLEAENDQLRREIAEMERQLLQSRQRTPA